VRALLLPIGEDTYAVPIELAREVVMAPVVTALPTAPASVLGVCNVRGEIIPVFDTGVVLGLGPMASFRAVALLETTLGPAALAITAIGGSVELGEAVAVTEAHGTLGAFVAGSQLAVLIDIEALLTSARVG
jgi:purine-binding chemotaxis protein CheW